MPYGVYMPDSLYERLITAVGDCVGKEEVILDCAIGPSTLGVHTAYGTGLAYVTPDAWQAVSEHGARAVEERVRGQSLLRVIGDYGGSDPLKVNIGLAAINSLLIGKGEEADSPSWYQWLKSKKRLGMVGYFCPIMDRVALTGVEPVIFELRDIPGTHRPEEAADLLPGCDGVLITGATFANKSVHRYLPHISPDAAAFIFGHSTPLADFLLGSFTLGSSRVTDKDKLFAGIRQGQGIRDVKDCIRKVIRRKEQ